MQKHGEKYIEELVDQEFPLIVVVPAMIWLGTVLVVTGNERLRTLAAAHKNITSVIVLVSVAAQIALAIWATR